MKRKIAALLVAVMTLSFAACGTSSETKEAETTETNETEGTEAEGPKYDAEVKDVKVGYYSFCGELHQFVAADKGYLEEEGLNVEALSFDNGSDALAALNAGTLDVWMTGSTTPPLNQIAQGADYMFFGGNMAQAGASLFARSDTKYDGYEDLVGKRIGYIGVGTEGLVLKDELEKAGYDVENDFEWVQVSGKTDCILGVVNGELDFSFCMTGFDSFKASYDLKDVWWPDDYYPMYSCCRLFGRREWVQENPNTVKALLRAYMRAQEYFDDEEYLVSLTMENLDQDREQAEGYLLNPHYVVHLDPLRNSILKDWEMALERGVIVNENNIDIEEYINTELYKEVLDDLTAENPDDEYYQDLQETFKEYNE